MATTRIDSLTPGMRECLRLVLTRQNSKEIARELGISPYTVDKRLERATHILNANSRFEAARALAKLEGNPQYETFVYEPADVEPYANPTSMPFPWPIRPKGARRNDLTPLARTGWIAALAFGIAVFTGMLLVAADALMRIAWTISQQLS